MSAAQEHRETELCGIALIGHHYSSLCQNSGRVQQEILYLIHHRWSLADDERQWCAELLSEKSHDTQDGSGLVKQIYSALVPDDFSTLAQCLGWFDSSDTAMQALLRDLPTVDKSLHQHLELFPEPVLSAFAVLGHEPTLNCDSVNDSFKEKIKLLHPDARIGVDLDASESAAADAIVKQLSAARETIRAHFQNLKRNPLGEPSQTQPSADSSEGDRTWELTTRTRELAQRVQITIQEAREIIKEAEQRVEEARNKQQSDILAIRNLTAQPVQETEHFLNSARAHLANQGIDSSVSIQATNESLSVPPNQADLRNAREAIENLKSLVNDEVLKIAKPRKAWHPNSGGAGCLMVFIGFAVGLIVARLVDNSLGFFAGFGAFYGGVMWWLHQGPVSKLQSVSAEVESRARYAFAILSQYSTEMSNRVDAELQSAERRFRAEIDQLDGSLQGEAIELRKQIASLWQDAKFSCIEWTTADWDKWHPSTSPAFAGRFATLMAQTEDLRRHLTSDLSFVLPALAQFPEGHGLLFKAQGAGKDRAAQAIQGLLARLLATIPPAKLRFTFIDPIALGSNVAAFMPLADHEESLVTSRAWSEPHHIEQRLGDLTEHMETIIQKYLRTEFKTIHDYNDAAKEVAEPYRFVVVFDFPVNFTDTAARRLVSIARNGARCGVYTFVVCDNAKPLPYGFSMDELRRSASVIEARSGRPETEMNWVDADFQPWQLQLDAGAPHKLLTSLIGEVGALAKDAMRVEVPYRKLLSLSHLENGTWWKATTAQSIRVPLGPTGARKLQHLVFGEGMAHHALIVGRPGSGKSNLMHVIITTLALTYPPDEIRLYLIDFKRGVEFKGYADCKLPHAEAIAIESEREFGLSVVERLDAELKRRGDLFRSVGSANIAEFRQKTGHQIPRVLLLVDEFQEFFTQDDQIARQTTLILDRLVRQGRAFGIHVILGSQTLAGAYNLPRSTLDQMAVRIAMQCSEADSRLILSDDNPAARLLSRPGEAIYNSASGLVEGNNLFQVARFSEEDSTEYLGLVSRIAIQSDKAVSTPIVFEGNELAQIADCRRLEKALNANDWQNDRRTIDLLLGDPIAIKDPVAARMQRQSGRNLLILSRDEAEGVGMCVAAIISILLQRRPGEVEVFIADFSQTDSEWAERAKDIEKHFPHEVKVLSRQREVAELVKSIADEVKRRIEAPSQPTSIFFFIQGMHRIRVLRGDECLPGEDGGLTPAEHFGIILRDGPEVGVHVISWCDTHSNAGRVVDRFTMNQSFGIRAGGAMNADDSTKFFDDAVASRIDKPHRIILFDEEYPGQLEKFRPYSMPSREWLEKVGSRLRQRTTI
jgi:hypothetical protein